MHELNFIAGAQVWQFTPTSTFDGGTWRLLSASWANPRSMSSLQPMTFNGSVIRFMDFGMVFELRYVTMG